MKVGLTYDLREDYIAEGYGEDETAEFDRPDTIDSIEHALRSLGYVTDRIGHIRHLVGRLAAGERWDLVFNIAEGIKGYAREAQVPALLDAYGIPYTFSDPMVLSMTLHKGMAKRLVRDLGIPTPDFVVVEDESGLDAVRLPYPLFVKPVAEGTSKGVTHASRVKTSEGLATECRKLMAMYGQPVLVETYLPGREFTISIIGTGNEAVALPPLEVILKEGAESGVYSYMNKENCEEVVDYRLADDPLALKARDTALAVWRGLGGRDAGRVDIRADAYGIPNFIEVNPLAGLHPEHSDLPINCTMAGISYRELIDRIMRSALKRIEGAL